MNFQVESIENVDADVLAVPLFGEEALTALVVSEMGKPMGGAGGTPARGGGAGEGQA